MFVEIIDLKEIARAQRVMNGNLKEYFTRTYKDKLVGYPAGNFTATVKVGMKDASSWYWWYGGLSRKGDKYLNLFGHFDPSVRNASLRIDLQFNFSKNEFNRMNGGVFVRHMKTDKIYLAHRGIVTRGKARVSRDRLLAEADVSVVRTEFLVDRDGVDVILVAPIDDAMRRFSR